eukprot:c3926_g1_i2.p1 GENE.c3926_g1_i2~~c3926_g1_i2.p1  ORF type:complete len:238 (+),score=70.09 c3926_g1_i2:251-964(+)
MQRLFSGVFAGAVIDTTRTALTTFSAQFGFDCERRIAILTSDIAEDGVTPLTDSFTVLTCVEPLPLRPSPPVKVFITSLPKHNFELKSTEWIEQRKSIEVLKPADADDIVVMDARGDVIEGSQSNFYAVHNGSLVTASENILDGTIRKIALSECARTGIRVELSPPNFRDIFQWEGAFISSTSRLMLPINELSWIDTNGKIQSRTFETISPLTRSIDDLVSAAVVTYSTEVVTPNSE